MLKQYAQILIKKLLVEKDNYSEHFFCIIVCLTFLFAALSTVFNLLVGLPMMVSLWSGILSIFLLLVLFLYRHPKKNTDLLPKSYITFR